MAIIGPGECAYKDYIDLYFILSEHHATLTDLIDVARKSSASNSICACFWSSSYFSTDVEDTGIQFLNTSVTRAELLSFFEAHPGSMLSASSSRPVHHNITASQVPAATKPAPAIREITRPNGTILSMSTKAEIVAIHSTFITPPTNKSAINTQQQPTQ